MMAKCVVRVTRPREREIRELLSHRPSWNIFSRVVSVVLERCLPHPVEISLLLTRKGASSWKTKILSLAPAVIKWFEISMYVCSSSRLSSLSLLTVCVLPQTARFLMFFMSLFCVSKRFHPPPPVRLFLENNVSGCACLVLPQVNSG